MHRSAIAVIGATLVSFIPLGGCQGQRESLPTKHAEQSPVEAGRLAQAPRSWIFDFWRSRSTPRVFLHLSKPSADPIASLVVTTDLPTARRVLIDVDLSHDDRFTNSGELGYAEAGFDRSGTTNVRLHGLVHGEYRVRARAVLADGSVVASAVEELVVLPPPGSHLPVAFEPNRGQTDESVLFLARAKNQMVYVTRDETLLVSGDQVTRFRLAGANSFAQPVGAKELPGISNYFIGNDPSKWRTNIETYQELLTKEVYPGIDLVYHSNRGRLEYDFHVAPGADPSLICLEFPDAVDLSIDADGELIARQVDGREVRKSAPILYQTRGDRREGVKGSWVLRGRKQAGYVVAGHDATRTLVIDPILFSTFYGGTGDDAGNGIALDAAGNIYVVGTSSSTDFPTTAGVFQAARSGGSDVVVMKLNPGGTAVLYATYLGGPGFDFGHGIAVDAAGNAYVACEVDSGFPVTPGAFQTSYQGGASDGSVSKLNPTGSTLLYSTFLGGTQTDFGNAIVVDAAGNAYVTGKAGSPNFPVTPGVVQTVGGVGAGDAFVTKLNPGGTALLYSTYHGGPGGAGTVGNAIAVDGAGNAYVAGSTAANLLPVTAGAFQATAPGGAGDGFVLKLNPTATVLLYSTYLGGATTDDANGLAIDAAGNAYVAGQTASIDFPTTAGVFQATLSGASDAFVTKLNPAGSAAVYSTYLGSLAGDFAKAIAIDGAGNAYVTGRAANTFPVVNPLVAGPFSGTNCFVTQVNPGGTALVSSSLLGGSGNETGNGIVLDAAGVIHVAGTTNVSPGFPLVSPLQATYGGGPNDIFIFKLTVGAGPPPPPPPPPPPIPNPLPGVLYGVTLANELITINTTTGAGTLVAPLASSALGLAFRGNSLYSWDQTANRIRQLNPATGATVNTIDIGVVAATAGDITFRSDGTGFLCAATPTVTLWSFDITVPSATTIVTPLTPPMYGLAIDPAGVLHGLRQNTAELYRINQATGAATLIGPSGLAPQTVGGLACDSAGNFYAAFGGFAGSSTLYRINATTGAATLIGSIGFTGVVDITFAPGGTPPVPPPPPGPSPGEGTYVGSKGAPGSGNEGCYGFGGGMRTLPILRGPTLLDGHTHMVLNVAYEPNVQPDSGNTWTLPACGLIAAAAFGCLALLPRRER